MAKKPVTKEEQNPFLPQYAIPESFNDYQDQSGEIAGYWDPELFYIHFTPEEVTLFDNKQDESKPSALIIGTLLQDMPLRSAEKDSDAVIQCSEGDRVGVWYSPGMRGIKDLAGSKVLLVPNGLKATGKQNDMKKYIVRSDRRGEKLRITNDHRKESKRVPTVFDAVAPAAPAPRAAASAEYDDAF